MKFTKLGTRFKRLLKKNKQGRKIKPEKFAKLLVALNDKKSGYEKKLKTELADEKRKLFESRLKVVKAHLRKTRKLQSAQSR